MGNVRFPLGNLERYKSRFVPSRRSTCEEILATICAVSPSLSRYGLLRPGTWDVQDKGRTIGGETDREYLILENWAHGGVKKNGEAPGGRVG